MIATMKLLKTIHSGTDINKARKKGLLASCFMVSWQGRPEGTHSGKAIRYCSQGERKKPPRCAFGLLPPEGALFTLGDPGVKKTPHGGGVFRSGTSIMLAGVQHRLLLTKRIRDELRFFHASMSACRQSRDGSRDACWVLHQQGPYGQNRDGLYGQDDRRMPDGR